MTTSTAFCVLRIAAFVTFLVRRFFGDVSSVTASRWLRSKRTVVSLQILQTIFRPVRDFERYNLQVHLWCWWECHRSCFWTSFATRWMSWKFCASVLSSLLIGNGLDVASCWCQPVGTQGSTVQFHVQEVIWEIGNFTLTGATNSIYTTQERSGCDVLCWNVDVSGRDPFDPYHTGNLGETQAADTKFVSVWQPSRTDTGFGCRISKRTRKPKQNKYLKWRE